MRESVDNYKDEFIESSKGVIEVLREIRDPLAQAAYLYSINEEKKNTNLMVRDINAKFDNIDIKLKKLDSVVERLDAIISRLSQADQAILEETPAASSASQISGRDEEILSYVEKSGKVCADEVQAKFEYKGRNAASARLSKLFQLGILEKVYSGKTVYYQKK